MFGFIAEMLTEGIWHRHFRAMLRKDQQNANAAAVKLKINIRKLFRNNLVRSVLLSIVIPLAHRSDGELRSLILIVERA